MLDPTILRKNINVVAKQLARRNFLLDVDTIRQQEKSRKFLQIKTENLQAKRNAKAKISGTAKARGEDIELLRQEVNQLNELLIKTKTQLKILQTAIRDYSLSIPNIPATEVPDGYTATDNLEVFRWGSTHQYHFPVKEHLELGEAIGGLDFTTAVKLTGTRFVVMKGDIARLYRAISQFMLDLHTEKHGYIEYYLPYMVNRTSLYGTGQLPKFDKELFYANTLFEENKNSSYALIPTAEVPLMNLLRNEIVDEAVLPIKMTAYTPCFRSEAGSYGKNTHGLIRTHQFDKVEIVQIVKPEHSMEALEELTGHAEKVLQYLHLPYRKVLLCTGDMGFSACKTYDLEVWLPSKSSYLEISSCSNAGDFQSRRIGARYRANDAKKPKLLHTLNGSGLAVGRTLVAVLENYQLANGSIEIPSALQPYMNGMKYIS